MGLPAGGVITYTWPLPSSCSDPGNQSGAVVWNGGYQASIYRRVQERDEYANGFSGGVTGKTVYTRTSLSNGPDSNHPTRSGGFGTQLDVDIQDGSGNQLRHETHWFYGDPSQSAAIPSSPTSYPAWSDGLEYKTQISQGGTQKELQQKLWQQQPCSGCWFDPSSDTSARMNSPLVCQQNTTLDSSDTSAVVMLYDFASDVSNNLVQQGEYNFGSAPALGASCPGSLPGGWFRATTNTYWYSSNSSYGPTTAGAPGNANLFTLPQSRKVQGSDGSQSFDWFSYDESAPQGGGGAPGHDDADFDTGYLTRGNLTTHQAWYNVTNTWIPETFTYDETGRVLSHKDFNTHTTSYAYSDTAHVFPTAVTNAMNQTAHFSWDANTLQPLTATDANNSVTQYNYNGDPLDRPTSVVRAAGVGGLQSNMAYSYPSVTQTTMLQDQNSTGDGALRTDQFTDGLGRTTKTVTYENSSSTITSSTTWDTLGRAVYVSNPYRSGDTITYTYTTYDALNRPLCVAATADWSQTCTVYSGKQSTVTDPAGNVKVMVMDAGGRISSVTEDPNGLNYLTTYLYDAFDDLTSVTQGAQTRTFAFDSRGRPHTMTNPENGTTTYNYDNNNNLISRTDNQNVTTTYGYDALNRLSTVTYAGARTAPNVSYYYDSGAPNSVGRLVSVWNSSGTAQQITGYDALGRITGSSETIGGTPYGSFGYTYNLADALVSETYPSGRVVTNAYDGANRVSGVSGVLSGASKTYVANASYAASGAIGAFNYAYINGAAAGTRTFSYNGNMQLGEMLDRGTSLFDLKYFYGGAATTGTPGASTAANIGSPTAILESAQKGSGSIYSFTQNYGYDHLKRLNSSTDSGGWTQNFNYDRYGNPWTTANAGLSGDRLPASNVYNAANNQSTYPGTGYDAGGVGNQTTMGAMQLTFDAENRIIQNYNTTAQNSTCYGYDGLGERVLKQGYGGSSCTGTAAITNAYVYDAFGNMAAETQTGLAPTPPCLTCYLTWDHQGSVRMISDATAGGFTGFHDYAPFGEEVLGNAGRTSDWGTLANGTDYLNQRYTGAERDTESTLDFLQARYLANQQGRFVSADPAGNFVADPANPQSWNMYGYAGNNPVGYLDPSGLVECAAGECSAGGGDCFDASCAEPCGGYLCDAPGGPIDSPPVVFAPSPVGGTPASAGYPGVPPQGMPSPNGGPFGNLGGGISSGGCPSGPYVNCLDPTPTGVAVFRQILTTIGGYALQDLVVTIGAAGGILTTAKSTQQDEAIWLKTGRLPGLPMIENVSHRKNARPSTRQDHQEGITRKKKDRGGEKGDERRRPPRKRPDGWKGPWPPIDDSWY